MGFKDSFFGLFDPVAGGKARLVLSSLYAAFVNVGILENWHDAHWFQIVSIVAAAVLFPGVGGATHMTSIGNIPPANPDEMGH